MMTRCFLKRIMAAAIAMLAVLACASQAMANDSSVNREMYRLYNTHSGEHFYTASVAERNSLR